MKVIETPKSSTIKKVTFDGSNLMIEFKTGGEYKYENVPPEIFKELEEGINKISVGRWYLSRIKGKYKNKKIS